MRGPACWKKISFYVYYCMLICIYTVAPAALIICISVIIAVPGTVNSMYMPLYIFNAWLAITKLISFIIIIQPRYIKKMKGVFKEKQKLRKERLELEQKRAQ